MALATPTATWFNDDHRLYADSVGRFFADHLVPNIEPVSYTHLTLPTKRIV